MVSEEADEEAKNQVKTKQRSAKEWLQLVIKLLKGKQAVRRATKDAKRTLTLTRTRTRTPSAQRRRPSKPKPSRAGPPPSAATSRGNLLFAVVLPVRPWRLGVGVPVSARSAACDAWRAPAPRCLLRCTSRPTPPAPYRVHT